ncbi:hypothetical protein HMPREF2626_01580 [Aerococcus sp. HMSC062A02]|uniref:major capsid protein n=1 Tax=Aerococcus sp. HMSC062A02 TaxID=1715105 RepID=UPI0008A5AC44|nr:major capsid protein [Aerococcus sp. HMSC062A02]OFN02628.1 hypothetical protein HMPREF2626_01580 [Aerococcus sp. HMSC062A02]
MSLVTDILTTQRVLDYTTTRSYPTQAGEALFPAQRQESMDFKYITGRNGAPVSASVHSLNTESEIGSRQGLKEVAGKVAMIKRKIGVDEELILQLHSLRQDSNAYKAVIDKIYNDIDAMVNAVNVRIERMRYEALATGKIVLNENNVKYEINYGLEDKQKTDVATKWDDPNANILDDIFTIVDKMVAEGDQPQRILTSRKVVALLAKNEKLQKEILGQYNSRRLSQNELNNFFTSQGLPVIGTEDRVYRAEDAAGRLTTHRYFADNKMVFLPGTAVGHTVYAPTPEEIRLAQNPAVDLSKVGNVIAMVYDEAVDPVATYTKAVAMALPSFEAADQVHIADVLAPTM